MTGDNEDKLDKVLDDIVEAKCSMKDLKIAVAEKEATESAKAVVDSYEDWKKKFPAHSKEELMAHGKGILRPVGDYYNKQFLDEHGDCYNIRKMSEAAQIFNPLFLCKLSTADIVTVLHELTELLDVFGFRHFTPRFLAELRKEQPKVVNEAKRDHDLARIPSTRQYLTRMQT